MSEHYIEFRNVSKAFDDNAVLKNVSFFVDQGETAVIMGRSGVGKSVSLKLLLGFLQPDDGQIIVAGQDVTFFTEEQFSEIRRIVTMVFQSGALFDSLTVAENVAFPFEARGARPDDEEVDRKVNELLKTLNLTEYADRLPSDLSMGTKRSVAIARALAEDPQAILYDEPTTMVDPLMAAHMSDLIVRLKKTLQKTSIVVTHDTHLAKKLADRVIFLQEGRVGFFGTWKELEASKDPFLRNFLEEDELIPALDADRVSSPAASSPKPSLPRVMGLWDVLLFNIATVLGPRWIASAAHNGTSSVTLWILAAVFFFVPTALVIVELSTRFPEEGGLYAWSKTAFGEFHGFVAGWTYWVYTLFYFPALLFASASMAAYIGGIGYAPMAQNRTFLLIGSFVLLFVAVFMNIIGLRIGKWLQNVGGVSTFLPLTILIFVAAFVWHRQGSVTHFTWSNIRPHWDWATVNFWPQIAFAFAGMELVSSMSEEVRDPRKTFPRAILGSGIVIAVVLHRGDDCGAFVDEQRGGGSEERRVSGADDCVGSAEDQRAGNDCGDAGDGGKCGRRGIDGGGNRASAFCDRTGSLPAARRSGKYIRNGRRRTFRFWCRRRFRALFCC